MPTAEWVLERQPAAVIVATGAHPTRTGYSTVAPTVRRVDGADQKTVFTPWDVIEGTTPTGGHAVVLDERGDDRLRIDGGQRRTKWAGRQRSAWWKNEQA